MEKLCAITIVTAMASVTMVFIYSEEWKSAFGEDYTVPAYWAAGDTQNVFLGGSTTDSVGSSLLLGTLIIDTIDFGPGTCTAEISEPVSNLAFEGSVEALTGNGAITVNVAEPGSLATILAGVATMMFRRGRMRRNCRAAF